MFGLSLPELGLILLVALLVLGPKRMPQVAKTIGKGLRELRKASNDLRSVIEEPLKEMQAPLQEMRKDIVETVYRIEDEIEKEARGGPANDGPEVAHGSEETARRIEAVYAAADPEGETAPAEAPEQAAIGPEPDSKQTSEEPPADPGPSPASNSTAGEKSAAS